MRRIARIQRPSTALAQCLHAQASAPQHTAACRAAAATCLQRPRDFSTTPQRPFHLSRRQAEKQSRDSEKTVTAEDSLPETENLEADAQQQAAEQLLEAYDEDAPSAAPEIETDLVLPPDEIEVAQRQDELAADGIMYEPSATADGLDVVGGLGGWFERDEHWGVSKRYTGFAPTHRVADAALLELNVRRATAEALAVAAAAAAGGHEQPLLLTGLWERGGREDAVRALGLRLEVRDDGAVGLPAADVEGVVRALRWDPEAPGSEVAVAGEEVGRQQFSREEAGEIVQAWDQGWKKISLHDARLKFAVSPPGARRGTVLFSFGSTRILIANAICSSLYRLRNVSSSSRATASPTPSCRPSTRRATSSRSSSSRSRRPRWPRRSSSRASWPSCPTCGCTRRAARRCTSTRRWAGGR